MIRKPERESTAPVSETSRARPLDWLKRMPVAERLSAIGVGCVVFAALFAFAVKLAEGGDAKLPGLFLGVLWSVGNLFAVLGLGLMLSRSSR